MNIVPISEARQKLPELVEKVDKLWERITITKKGKAKAILMSADEWEDWMETIEILSSPRSIAAIRKAEKERTRGEGVPYEKVKKELKELGKL